MELLLQYQLENVEIEEEMVLLIKLDVSTKWWQALAKYPWIAVNKRIRFGEGIHNAPFQSAIVYLGKDLDRFNQVFGKYGFLYKRGDI